ncbi:UNVERIFIED_CONTAM: Polypyrimidine tract-binding protein3 [Sesamum calycinum]|uniref:Polypyrimidine tract-binding protein3 n=1 Tax=Sesamum calycinum TaxID=2727403 RepID=A0AAW2KDU8_9LAMI
MPLVLEIIRFGPKCLQTLAHSLIITLPCVLMSTDIQTDPKGCDRLETTTRLDICRVSGNKMEHRSRCTQSHRDFSGYKPASRWNPPKARSAVALYNMRTMVSTLHRAFGLMCRASSTLGIAAYMRIGRLSPSRIVSGERHQRRTREPKSSLLKSVAVWMGDGAMLFGKRLEVNFSKHPNITTGADTHEYSNSNLNRFNRNAAKNYRYCCSPTKMIHISTLPQDVTEEEIISHLEEHGAIVPESRRVHFLVLLEYSDLKDDLIINQCTIMACGRESPGEVDSDYGNHPYGNRLPITANKRRLPEYRVSSDEFVHFVREILAGDPSKATSKGMDPSSSFYKGARKWSPRVFGIPLNSIPPNSFLLIGFGVPRWSIGDSPHSPPSKQAGYPAPVIPKERGQSVPLKSFQEGQMELLQPPCSSGLPTSGHLIDNHTKEPSGGFPKGGGALLDCLLETVCYLGISFVGVDVIFLNPKRLWRMLQSMYQPIATCYKGLGGLRDREVGGAIPPATIEPIAMDVDAPNESSQEPIPKPAVTLRRPEEPPPPSLEPEKTPL